MLWECPEELVEQALEKFGELDVVFPDYPCKILIGKYYGELVTVDEWFNKEEGIKMEKTVYIYDGQVNTEDSEAKNGVILSHDTDLETVRIGAWFDGDKGLEDVYIDRKELVRNALFGMRGRKNWKSFISSIEK